jgi:uncharacterized protein YbcC (UPF0753/DUF2309 family)
MLQDILASIRQKLPLQNPLHAFVHNNILQTFEHRDFHEAVAEAGKLYRARPYWPIFRYVEKYAEKKISDDDVSRAIDHYGARHAPILSLPLLGIAPRDYFYRLMFSELSFNDDETQPEIADRDLWERCREKTDGASLVLSRSRRFLRAREYWEKYHDESYALSLHPFAIRLISSYLDQGQSFWANPFRGEGFWAYFLYDVTAQGPYATGWEKVLAGKVEACGELPPEAVIEAELRRTGLPVDQWETYLLEILFDLKGWSGMVNKLETEPWQAPVKAPAIRLVDYLAALVLMEAAMDAFHGEAQSIELALLYGRREPLELKGFQLAVALYQITRSFRPPEHWLRDRAPAELLTLVDEIDASEHRDRVRLWHEAYEHHFYREAIDALKARGAAPPAPATPAAQILCCIDDREESFRRHLEEVDPELETFGVVGFFGIDMNFVSVKNKRPVAQCPPVVTPSRVVREVAVTDAAAFKRWNFFRGTSDLGLYYHSRTLFRGFLATLVLGVASLVPMVVQVFFPEHNKFLRRKFAGLFGREPETELAVCGGEHGVGYSPAEQAQIVLAVIRMCGLRDLAPLVVLLGHGSSSNNNPFRQAYGCGACGGNAGIPNSRAYAKMANDPLVRAEVEKLGFRIPAETFFVAGFHDTATDEVLYMNERALPERLRAVFERVKGSLRAAAELNAFERCRRFSSFDEALGPAGALRHVRERAHDIAQPRPEYGHSSNALAIVARRSLTRGLYMNRRSFLLSYDWTRDPDGAVLRQVVLGGVPVAVNINMDYYFSAVDNDNFGCGSKLPLNMTSLLGVMTGSQSDLRIGLARQMVEIHEPVRNLTVVEAPLARVRALFDGHPRLRNLLHNHWMRLAVADPETGKWWMFAQHDFVEVTGVGPRAKDFRSSIDLVRNNDPSDFAEIKNGR